MSSQVLFSTIEVTKQIFYRSQLSYAIVNLKPIVPGHVLVVPNRPVGRLSELNSDELSCLMNSIQRVGGIIEKAFGGDGLTIACQDGKAAGQSVPHVHFHVLPRKHAGDRFSGEKNDDVYPALENAEIELESVMREDKRHMTANRETLRVDNEERLPRTMVEMEDEARWLKGFFSVET